MQDAIQTDRGSLRSVIHVINGEHYSGAERVQDLLAARLTEFGYEVQFACVKPGRFAAMRHCHTAAIHNLPMRLRIDLRPAFALARIARQSAASVLHAHTPRSLIVARLAAMLTHVPLVYHVHSPASDDSTRSLQNWVNGTTERLTLSGVDRLIAVSASLAQRMQAEGIDAERIATVPNGVPTDGPLSDRPTPHDVWTLGTVALFRPRKGLEVLLKTLAQLRDQKVAVRLRAVGGFETTDYEQEICRYVDELHVGHLIDWVGFTKNVSAELRKMDLLVLPSLFGEGLPMVVLESMAAGVPVVSTRVEGVPEAVRNGQEGVLVEPGSAEALRRGIKRVVDEPGLWARLRVQAYQRHAEQFSDRRMAEQVSAVYDKLLSAPAGEAQRLEAGG